MRGNADEIAAVIYDRFMDKLGAVVGLVALVACGRTDDEKQMAANHARAERCKEALAHWDRWSSSPLPDGCKPPEVAPACEPTSERARLDWLDKPIAKGEELTPARVGMSADGRCHRQLVYRDYACDRVSVANSVGGKPFINSALEIGFTELVCDHGGARATFDLSLYRSSK